VASAIVTCPNCGKKNRVPAVKSEGVPQCAICHAKLPWLVDVDAGIFDAAVDASVPVLVEMWAPWCGPCKMVAPAVEELARSHAGELKVVKLNIDNAPAIAARFGIQGIPALVLLRGGQEIDRLVGAAPPRQLESWIEPHLATPAGA
jgi:thioredoxin 2